MRRVEPKRCRECWMKKSCRHDKSKLEVAAHIIVFRVGRREFTAICGGKGLVPMQADRIESWAEAARVAIARTECASRRKRS